MRSIRRLIGVAAIAVGSLMGVSSASAVVPPVTDPIQTNIPYVAWIGEHVKVTACVPESKATFAGGIVYQATFTLGDWTGRHDWHEPYPVSPNGILGLLPQAEIVPADTTADGVGLVCFSQVWASDKPGLAKFKVHLDLIQGRITPVPVLVEAPVVRVVNTNPDFPSGRDLDAYAIWMTFDRVDLAHADGSTGTKDVYAGGIPDNCRVTTDNELVQGVTPVTPPEREGRDDVYLDNEACNYNRIQAHVHGSFPMLQNWEGKFANNLVKMPEDWPLFAAKFATLGVAFGTNSAQSWDIHDDNTDVTGHYKGAHVPVKPGLCPVIPHIWFPSYLLVDTDSVENCMSDDPIGPFTRVSDPTLATSTLDQQTVGPFDPLVPDGTWLPDGKLDQYDAPMPAARLDFAITPNSGVKGDLSGVGNLVEALKEDVYARADPVDLVDKKTYDHPAPYYAPFYSQHIPATARLGWNSGITGSEIIGVNGAQFGWLDYSEGDHPFGTYENWSDAATLAQTGGSSSCLWYFKDFHERTQQGQDPIQRPLPEGDATVAVYTDEHGEAMINWQPGFGFYWDQLGLKNLNRGCDLKGIDVLGTADLTATARYPYQPEQWSDPKVSGKVSFKVHSKFSKTLTVYPKGTGTDNNLARIIVAHAQDVDGSAFQREVVCFSSSGLGMKRFGGDDTPLPGPDGIIGTEDDVVIDVIVTKAAEGLTSLGRLCSATDENGNAAIEVYANGGDVTVIADFASEGLLRGATVDFKSLSTVPVVSVNPPTAIQIGTVLKAQASGPVKDAASKVLIQPKAKKVAHKLRLARLVTPAGQKAHLVVRVNGKAGSVRILIKITAAGKTHTSVRIVKTNKTVTVKKLRVPKNATKVAVSVLGS